MKKIMSEDENPVFEEENRVARKVRQLGAPVTADDYQALGRSYVKLLRKASKIVRIGDSTHHKLIRTQKQLQETLDQLRQTQETLVQQERLGALGQMSRGIAHDFNNALQPIILAASMLDAEEKLFIEEEFGRKYLEIILKTANEAAATVKRLARFYRPLGPGDRKDVDIRELIHEVIEVTKPRWKDEAQSHGTTIQINTDFQERCFVHGLQSELAEVLMSITFNAIEAIDSKGSITYTVYRDGEWCVIEVTDTGAGMDDETRKHCFEPFYTTKLQRGSGLGLSTAYGLVKGHKGTIEAESNPGEGTKMKIHLPAVEKDHTETEQAESPETAKKPCCQEGGPCRILVVDDEEMIRNILSAMLERYGHKVTTAISGTDGWNKFQKGPSQDEVFDLVVTDQAMPGMPGDQMAQKIKGKSPETPVIMLTGFGDLMKAQGQAPKHIDALLSKPVAPRTLHETILSLVK